MERIKHKITYSETRYGVLSVSPKVRYFYEDLPERFEMEVKGEVLHSRYLGTKKIWMGYIIMRQFNEGEIITLTKKDSRVIIT